MMDEQKKYIRNDIILIITLCIIAIGLCIWVYGSGSKSELKVEVLINGELVESIDFDDNSKETITLQTGNVINIDKGCVYMLSAECPDGLCVKQGEINNAGESIICLPHKVVVRIVEANGQEENDIDTDNGLDVMPR